MSLPMQVSGENASLVQVGLTLVLAYNKLDASHHHDASQQRSLALLLCVTLSQIV